jgi:hypothetical protein
MRLPDVMASLDGIAPHVPSLFIFLYLATKIMISKLTCVLRYVALLRLRLRLRLSSSALHLHTHTHTSIAYLLSGTIRHVITARCLSAAYPGIQPTVLYLLLILPPPMSCSILLTH